MMPLWTTAKRSVAGGCELPSLGRPWWPPMPTVPMSGSRREPSSKITQFVLARRRVSSPLSTVATPAEQWPALLKRLERVDEQACDRLTPENAHNSCN